MGEQAGQWFRVSTKQQDEANQVPDVQAWCDSHGYDVKRTYTLHGASASKGQHQKQLDDVLDDMRSGIITVLVVWTSSRIERRGAENAFDLAKKVREAGGRIEYVKDTYLNVTNDMSDVMLALSATQNKMYSKNLSDASKRTVANIRANGAFFGRPPWGYAVTGIKGSKKLVPSDDGWKYIPELYARVIAGIPLRDTAAWLTQETGKQFWAKTLGTMIRNPVYMGTQCEEIMVGGKKTWGNAIHECEPLVDARTFKLADEVLSGKGKRGPWAPENRAMLAKAISCPRCENSPMYRVYSPSGSVKIPYYRCTGRGAQRRGCGNMVRVSIVDEKVNNFFAGYGNKRMIRTTIPGVSYQPERDAIKLKMSRMMLGDMSVEEFTNLKGELDSIPADTVDTVDWVEDADTYADLWSATPVSERGEWLTGEGFAVYADKDEVTVSGFDGNLVVKL